ncbi:hypothetical protein [Deefgea rivuli]|uniref:hypothetical protein n=1 Tax=Deefgea rivuli TaxID=400948 RepID=UPI000482E249|nr:hypothetical protein [Deefgea rivuli]
MQLVFKNSVVVLILIALVIVHYTTSKYNLNKPRQATRDYMSIYLPVPAQLINALGDRYLAANINVIRTFMVGTDKLPAETLAVQAQLQKDAAFYNPAHEDNYYVAAATLPWNNHLTEAQYILNAAKNSRPNDPMPAFFYAFNQLHFESAPIKAANTLRDSAKLMQDEKNKTSMEALAARWYGMGDKAEAAKILRLMAQETRNKAFSAYLKKRATRMDILSMLNKAKLKWEEKNNGQRLSHLKQLTDSGTTIPTDPLGGLFILSPNGQIISQEAKTQ